ncbi:MAG UNVERIFIED_CONTAM: MarR family transcriptional regulator [Rickettsiaceae bacterium]|jgi:DNA-binding MarR family transcriptional regulator
MSDKNESPFGFARPEDSPGFLLWQTTLSWQRVIKKALDKHDISHSQFVIMALLLWFESNGYSPTQILIANYSKLDKMTVSKSLKKLAKLGVVSRISDEKDTRAKNVFLTKNGKELIHTLVPIVEDIDAAFFRKIDKIEEGQLIRIMQKIIV